MQLWFFQSQLGQSARIHGGSVTSNRSPNSWCLPISWHGYRRCTLRALGPGHRRQFYSQPCGRGANVQSPLSVHPISVDHNFTVYTYHVNLHCEFTAIDIEMTTVVEHGERHWWELVCGGESETEVARLVVQDVGNWVDGCGRQEGNDLFENEDVRPEYSRGERGAIMKILSISWTGNVKRDETDLDTSGIDSSHRLSLKNRSRCKTCRGRQI